MKELELIKPDKEIVNRAQQPKPLKFLGNMRLRPGMKVWEIDGKEVREATFVEPDTIGYDGKPTQNKKLFIKPNCFYCVAINAQNAMKKAGFKVNKLQLKKAK